VGFFFFVLVLGGFFGFWGPPFLSQFGFFFWGGPGPTPSTSALCGEEGRPENTRTAGVRESEKSQALGGDTLEANCGRASAPSWRRS
jgi:hypothetical protein